MKPSLALRLILFVILISFLAEVGSAQELDPLAESFRQPPASAKPRTYWLWMNGNVSREGITLDLEAMQRVGVGGVMIFDGSTYLPAGPAGYLNPEWRALMVHAMREGARLGVEIGMHNGPGWSSSGGPWITPDRAMQQLVSTETTVAGGQTINLKLSQPQTNEGFYRDAYIIAFPSLRGEQTRYEDDIARVTGGAGLTLAKEILSDGDWNTSVKIRPGEPLIIELNDERDLYGITVQPTRTGHFSPLDLETSNDGTVYTRVCSISNPGQYGIRAPAVRSFGPVRARWARLTATAECELGEVILQRAPRIVDWAAKANFDYRVAGPVALSPTTATNATAIDPRSVVNITEHFRDGILQWQVPPGTWTILRIGYTPTGKQNVAASAAGVGLDCDKLNAAATEYHFNHVEVQVLADAAAAGTKGPTMLMIDSYETGLQNWTAAFPEEFRRRASYDITGFLPALFGRIVGDAAISDRFLFDFRRAQADLMAEYYYGRMGQLANAHGMKFYVEGYGPGNFDELRASGVPDVPMTEFWARTPWTPNRTVKMVSSAAHIYGKPVVAAESFTGEAETSRWLGYPYALKILGDDMFSLGMNQVVFHRYAHQPNPTAAPGMTMGPWGSHLERTNTWYGQSAGWMTYLARTGYMLRQGIYQADVLYFTGERPPDSSQFAIPVLPAGYTYDLINADVLLHRVAVDHGDLTLPEGGRYRLLVLPADLKAMTPDLMHRVHDLVAAGAKILGPEPIYSPTLTGFPASEKAMKQWADETWHPAHPLSGQTYTGLTPGEVLAKIGVYPDFEYKGARPDDVVSWTHRKIEGADLFFVGNRQRRATTIVASFRGMAGRAPEIWQPETAERSMAVVSGSAGDRALLPLQLGPAESLFILFRHPASASAPIAVEKDGEPLLSVALAPSAPATAATNFTMALWVKPDTDLRVMPAETTSGRIDEVGKFYAIPADPGDVRFGAGQATAGLAVGRNGIYIVERSTDRAPAVLVSPEPISGWTHVAVVYRDGTPRLYINGRFVREGLKSGRVVHSGVGSPPPPPDYILHFPGIEAMTRAAGEEPPPSRGQVYFFEGNSTPAESFDRAMSDDEISRLASAGVPPPELPVLTDLARTANGSSALIWRSGSYALHGRAPLQVRVADPETLAGSWRVEFPPNLGAPSNITLPRLESLHRNSDTGVKYFSGTATYIHALDIPAAPLAPNTRVVLDLGRVEVLAEVRVNGQSAGIVWKEPYRLDITNLVKRGSNRLEVRVTDLWTNRLIGDEQLPPEDAFGFKDERGVDPHGIVRLPQWYLEGKPKPPGGRITFATWHFYDQDAPLVASGLLGPVRVLYPVRAVLPN